ncbi:hypothetical protein HYU06_05645 [Candidatus Woesearchaeota archaeon]|nr:hypothetical protein [Candidatus Woesearchaeota archaeon]
MKESTMLKTLSKIEGLQTLETAAKALNIKPQSALNLLSKLKKEGYVTVTGGGKKIRLYKITMRKQLPRQQGMFDILNKYNPNFKLNPWYDHQVHGIYTVEDALIDAIQTGSFRAILASLRLFQHIKNWPKLYKLAKEKDCWQKVGALYDVAKIYFRVRRMSKKYINMVNAIKQKQYLIKDYLTKEEVFKQISHKWKAEIPFRKGDLDKVIVE